MLQIDEHDYEKLRKDADDNRQIVRMTRLIVGAVCGMIIFLILFFSWGVKLIDLDVQKKAADIQTQASLAQAEVNKKVMIIESEGMTIDEYLKWLEIRNKGSE